MIEVATETGIVARRGYSMEPDLLFDVEDAGARSDAILDVLKQRGFKRVRDFKWRKELPVAGEMFVDLFVPPDADEATNPGGFTTLPACDLAFARAKPVELSLPSGLLEIKLPDPVGFLAMKLEAKLRLRPKATKDSFDLYAYVVLIGVEVVHQALCAHDEGGRIAAQLRQLFAEVDSPGVVDVLTAVRAPLPAPRPRTLRLVESTVLSRARGRFKAGGLETRSARRGSTDKSPRRCRPGSSWAAAGRHRPRRRRCRA